MAAVTLDYYALRTPHCVTPTAKVNHVEYGILRGLTVGVCAATATDESLVQDCHARCVVASACVALYAIIGLWRFVRKFASVAGHKGVAAYATTFIAPTSVREAPKDGKKSGNPGNAARTREVRRRDVCEQTSLAICETSASWLSVA